MASENSELGRLPVKSRWICGIKFDIHVVHSFLQRAEEVGSYTEMEREELKRGHELMNGVRDETGGLYANKEQAMIGWGLDFLQVLGLPHRPVWSGGCEGLLTHCPPTDDEWHQIAAIFVVKSSQEFKAQEPEPWSVLANPSERLLVRDVFKRISALFGQPPRWFLDHHDACYIRDLSRQAEESPKGV